MSRKLSDCIWFVVFLLCLSCKSDYKRVDSSVLPNQNVETELFVDNTPDYLDSLPPEEGIPFSVPLEKWPEFPGGQNGLTKFLKRNLRWPKTNACVNGVVYVSFFIRKDGNVTDIAIAKGLQEDYNAEAMRVVALMPRWKPGQQSGKPVDVRYTLPIRFGLSN